MNIKDNAVAASPAIPGPWSIRGDLICGSGRFFESLRMLNHFPNRYTDTRKPIFLVGMLDIQLHQDGVVIISRGPGDLP